MKKVPEPMRALSAEREYYRDLRKYSETYIKIMREALKEIIPGLRELSADEQPRLDARHVRLDDNISDKVQRMISMVDAEMAARYPDGLLMRWALSMVGKVNKHTKTQVNRMFRDQVEIKGQNPDFTGLMKDGKLTPFFRNVAEENVGLIRSIPKLKQQAFQNQLVALITADSTMVQITDAIQNHFQISRDRARLIARDQTGKMNGRLEEFRQKQLGIKEYIWRTSQDERVRHPKNGKRGPDHKRLDGKKFSWDKPPIVNTATGKRANPKQDFQCRCWAEPVFDDLLS